MGGGGQWWWIFIKEMVEVLATEKSAACLQDSQNLLVNVPVSFNVLKKILTLGVTSSLILFIICNINVVFIVELTPLYNEQDSSFSSLVNAALRYS